MSRPFRRAVVHGLLATIATACIPHAPRNTDALFGQPGKAMLVIGHRGAAGLAPENTHAAFAKAAELGVPFELDITLSKDGELVVIHDDTLDRTTTGQGAVAATVWADIHGLDAGSWLDSRWAGEPVPRLADVLEEFGDQVVIDIEIKTPPKGVAPGPVAQATVEAIRAAGLAQRCFVTSFNPFVLEAVKQAGPEIIRGQLTGTFRGADLKWYEKLALRNLALNDKATPDLIAAEAEFLEHRGHHYVRALQRRGYRVLAWTVNDPQMMLHLADIGVDGLITDRPDLAIKVLSEHPRGPAEPAGR